MKINLALAQQRRSENNIAPIRRLITYFFISMIGWVPRIRQKQIKVLEQQRTNHDTPQLNTVPSIYNH